MKSKFNKSNIKLAIATAILVGSTGISTASYAENVASGGSGTLNVTTLVSVACTLGTSTMAFPNYNPGVDTNTASTTLSATCTNGASVSLKLSDGSNALNGVRRMIGGGNGSETLIYDVYLDDGHGQRWGKTATGSSPDVYSYTSDGTLKEPTVYGKIQTAQTNATGGSYTDAITITAVY